MARNPIMLTLVKCAACHSFKTLSELIDRLCFGCVEAGWHHCAFCYALTGQFRKPCPKGHPHDDLCPDCATHLGVCPDSDEAQVVKVVME